MPTFKYEDWVVKYRAVTKNVAAELESLQNKHEDDEDLGWAFIDYMIEEVSSEDTFYAVEDVPLDVLGATMERIMTDRQAVDQQFTKLSKMK